jgi:hypothetical protein
MPNPADQLAALAEADRLLTAHGIDYWLFGGWAVDFHVGRVTREHADIDMAIWVEDNDRLGALLAAAAWRHRPEPDDDGYTSYERGSVRLEVAFLARDERGEVYTPLRTGRGAWPDDSFGNATAELHGVRARLVNRASLIADKSVVHSDGQAATKDRADVASLLGQREAPTAR